MRHTPLIHSTRSQHRALLCLSVSLALSSLCVGCQGDAHDTKSSKARSASGKGWGKGRKGKGEGKARSRDRTEAGEEATEKEIPVEVTHVKRSAISAVVRAVAVVEPKEKATVRALASGLLSELKVDEGAKVKRGAKLAHITRLGASSLLQKSNDAYLKAKQDARRVKALVDKGLAPVDEHRQARHLAQQSALDLRRLRQEAKNERVISPIQGVITQRLINRGEQVSLGQALFEVMDLRELRVPLFIPDQWSSKLKPGLKVRLFDRQQTLITSDATVSLVSPIVNAQSGTIKVFVTPPKGAQALKPGLFVSAEVILDTIPEALTLPRHVLLYRDDEPWVVVAEDGRAKLVKVTLGYTQGDLVEVRSPLEEGALVVSYGQRGLEEGAPLKLTTEGEEHDKR